MLQLISLDCNKSVAWLDILKKQLCEAECLRNTDGQKLSYLQKKKNSVYKLWNDFRIFS